MELTNEQLEAIREAVKTVEYGSVTIHISATSKHLDLEVQRRVRIETSRKEKKFGSFQRTLSRGCP
jgi:hypothetical protein